MMGKPLGLGKTMKPLAVLAGVMLLFGARLGDEPPSQDALRAASLCGDFAFPLLRSLNSSPGGLRNLLVSPQDVYRAMALGYAGAAGETAAELASVMRYEAPERLLPALKELRELQKADALRGDASLAQTACVWIDRSYVAWSKRYVEIVSSAFGPEMAEACFYERERSAKEINAWISKSSGGRLDGLLPESDLKSLSDSSHIEEPAMVLASGIYFKGLWNSRFPKDDTASRPFSLDKGGRVDVPFMAQRYSGLFLARDGMKLASLEYEGSRFSFCAILPDDMEGLPKLVAELDSSKLAAWLDAASLHEIDMRIPSFEFDCETDISTALKAMGLSAPFKSSADFSKMQESNVVDFNVYLRSVRHKAHVKIDEEGSEAVASTTAVFYCVGCAVPEPEPPPPKAVFHADHPFIFLIRHNPTGALLFLGLVANPSL